LLAVRISADQNGSEPAPTRDAMRRVFARVAEKCNLPPLPAVAARAMALVARLRGDRVCDRSRGDGRRRRYGAGGRSPDRRARAVRV